MCIFCLWAHLSPTKPTHVCIILASWSLRIRFQDFNDFLKMFPSCCLSVFYGFSWFVHDFSLFFNIVSFFHYVFIGFFMVFHTRQRFQCRASQKVKLFTFWYTLYSNRGPVPGPRPAPPKGINSSEKWGSFVYGPTWAPQSPHRYATYLPFEACEVTFSNCLRFFHKIL